MSKFLPSFLFLAFAVFAAWVQYLVVSIGGDWVMSLAVITGPGMALGVISAYLHRPRAEEAPLVWRPLTDAEKGYSVSPELRTLNADLWAAEAFGFYTLGSLPQFGCAVPFCEHTPAMKAALGGDCFCAEDCNCPTHASLRGEFSL